MKVTITDHDGSYHDVVFIRTGRPSVVSANLTSHDLNDLEAVLAARKAMSSTCDDERGEHTCGLRHTSGPHQCRACPETWL